MDARFAHLKYRFCVDCRRFLACFCLWRLRRTCHGDPTSIPRPNATSVHSRGIHGTCAPRFYEQPEPWAFVCLFIFVLGCETPVSGNSLGTDVTENTSSTQSQGDTSSGPLPRTRAMCGGFSLLDLVTQTPILLRVLSYFVGRI